jgi:hypothetical protein
MSLLELRILPPLAVGRLGAAREALEAFDLETDPARPLDYRRIVPRTSFEIDEDSGRIVRAYLPASIRFKDQDNKVRPVAPFLEVFVRTSAAPGHLRPLTVALLEQEGLTLADLHWDVHVGNIKIFRRTGDPDDQIHAVLSGLRDHARHPLEGVCKNFLPGKKLPLGHVQFIAPCAAFPEIRLRFTPAGGLVYGSRRQRLQIDPHSGIPVLNDDPVIHAEHLVLYDESKSWVGYVDQTSPRLTNPASIYAGYADGDNQVSWGYLDDECDGVVSVVLKLKDDSLLSARATIGAGPPAYAPDTLPVRVVSDEMEQLLFGPEVADDEISLDSATALVLRALESVRLMNTAVMNGNPVNGRLNVASTMVRQNSSDFERYYEPIAASTLVDNLALQALHERVFSALAAGGAPWFAQSLRQPEEIGDLSAGGLRKMPAMMRGADGRSLTLTRRHIDMVVKAAANAMFSGPTTPGEQ